MNDDAEYAKKSPYTLSTLRCRLLVILAGMMGKFFGLVGGAIFLGL